MLLCVRVGDSTYDYKSTHNQTLTRSDFICKCGQAVNANEADKKDN